MFCQFDPLTRNSYTEHNIHIHNYHGRIFVQKGRKFSMFREDNLSLKCSHIHTYVGEHGLSLGLQKGVAETKILNLSKMPER